MPGYLDLVSPGPQLGHDSDGDTSLVVATPVVGYARHDVDAGLHSTIRGADAQGFRS
jgi:hypothetical protein